MSNFDRENYLAQFKTTPEEVLGERLLPPKSKTHHKMLFPIANQQKKYTSPDAFAHAIELYFESCQKKKKHPTMAGLSLALGFTSVNALKRYQREYEDYAPVLETAETMMEDYKNSLLLDGGKNTQGLIFDLKNRHGWADKVEQVQQTQTDTLALLVKELQGKVLRPRMTYEEAVDAQFSEGEEHDLI